MLNVEKELATLQRMTPAQLREKYAEVFGEPSRSSHKQWLVKRVIWRMQANEEGDLSERARRRAFEIANDADLRLQAPRAPKQTTIAVGKTVQGTVSAHDKRLPMLGTIITREYKGRTLQVTVLADGFSFEGEKYKSLSALAKSITGSHCSGFLFFGLEQKGAKT